MLYSRKLRRPEAGLWSPMGRSVQLIGRSISRVQHTPWITICS